MWETDFEKYRTLVWRSYKNVLSEQGVPGFQYLK